MSDIIQGALIKAKAPQEKLEKYGFRRNVELTITIGADSWHHFHRALREIEFMLDKERVGYIDICSGGCNNGFTVNGDVDPEWDEERHEKAIIEWREKKMRPQT